MTIHEARQRLLFQLYEIYESREAVNIADLVMEQITGWKKIDRILNKNVPLLPNKIEILEKYTEELLAYKPIQYVLGEAWFYGMHFFVNEHVLIPRPETEELVQWAIGTVDNSKRAMQKNITVLDVGTGSGCISISLKKNLPFAEVYACDISQHALNVAEKNAIMHDTVIQLLQIDFLDKRQWNTLPPVDIIISNPPYVPLNEKETLAANVVLYEPHVALFVDNNDPLIFYKAIADFAKEKMKPGGKVYAEIHERLASDVQQVFVEKDLTSLEVKKDMQGKPRMIRVLV
jgi:release factor glutamine methyltransferase